MPGQLMSVYFPYVHSNRDNFSGVYDLSLHTNGIDRLAQKKNQLITIASSLYSAAANFLGVSEGELKSLLRMKQISDELLGLDNDYYRTAMQILNDRTFINLLIRKQTYDAKKLMNMKQLPNGVRQLLRTNSKELLDPTIQQLARAIINSFPKRITIGADGPKEDVKIRINEIKTFGLDTDVFSNSVVKVLKKDGKRLEELVIKSIQNSKTFANAENKQGNNQYSKEAEEYFRKTFLQLLPRNLTGPQAYDERIVKDYLEKIIQSLKSQGIFNLTETSRAHVQGKLGEAGIAAQIETVNENKEAQIKVRVTGAMKEQEVMEKIFNQKISQVTRLLTHDITKQSYSDLVLIRNGRMARVQSKNYLGIVNNWIQSGGENRIASITTDSNSKNLIEFLNMAQNQNALGNIDMAAISYVLANEMWFKNHVSYGGGNKGDKSGFNLNNNSGSSFDFDKINRALSEVLYNFIGVVVDESIVEPNIIAEQSNLFYILSNGVMVPTGLLVEGIAKSLENEQYGLMNLNIRLKSDGSYVYPNAKNFYNAKLQAIRGSNDSTRYTNPKLLSIGQTQGASIIKTLKIDSAKVRFSLNDLLNKSAYNI